MPRRAELPVLPRRGDLREHVLVDVPWYRDRPYAAGPEAVPKAVDLVAEISGEHGPLS
jgi:hypothetical protein